jgi:hypothetical protein
MSSMTLQEFIDYLPQMKRKVISNVQTSLYNDAVEVLEELKERSPLDEGVFRIGWELRSVRGSNAISKLRIQNKTPYGIYLDQGGTPGDHPWYWPSAHNPGPKSKSGKLVIFNGRVWAGGRSPQGFVVGGLVDPVIFYNQKKKNQIAVNLAKAVIEAI